MISPELQALATSMLNNLNWPSLKQRRDVAEITMFLRLLKILFQFHMITFP